MGLEMDKPQLGRTDMTEG